MSSPSLCEAQHSHLWVTEDRKSFWDEIKALGFITNKLLTHIIAHSSLLKTPFDITTSLHSPPRRAVLLGPKRPAVHSRAPTLTPIQKRLQPTVREFAREKKYQSKIKCRLTHRLRGTHISPLLNVSKKCTASSSPGVGERTNLRGCLKEGGLYSAVSLWIRTRLYHHSAVFLMEKSGPEGRHSTQTPRHRKGVEQVPEATHVWPVWNQ